MKKFKYFIRKSNDKFFRIVIKILIPLSIIGILFFIDNTILDKSIINYDKLPKWISEIGGILTVIPLPILILTIILILSDYNTTMMTIKNYYFTFEKVKKECKRKDLICPYNILDTCCNINGCHLEHIKKSDKSNEIITHKNRD